MIHHFLAKASQSNLDIKFFTDLLYEFSWPSDLDIPVSYIKYFIYLLGYLMIANKHSVW